MKLHNPTSLASTLSKRIGLIFQAESGFDYRGQYIRLYPVEVDSTEGFSVWVRPGLSHVYAEFVPGTFSKPLIREMGNANMEQKVLFRSFAQAALSKGCDVKLIINESLADPINVEDWPESWMVLSLVVRLASLDMREDTATVSDAFLSAGETLIGMVLSLLPLESTSDDQPAEFDGYAEGDIHFELVTKHERNPLNRAACIQLKGTNCHVCGFSFERVYGSLGTGFIHVHHITPVSAMQPGSIIDPATDLVPICPNCHCMLHRRTPPLTVEELRAVLRDEPSIPAH
ncbi:MAG: HNH endonuclease [Coriobacteriia bacterium]